MGKRRKWGYIGKYQKTIYIWTSIFFIVVQIAFSVAILVETNRQEIQSNYEMNEQIFQQVAYNVEQSDEVIRAICKSLFVNPKLTKILYSVMKEESLYDWSKEFQSICDQILLSNPKIHSIYVYNGEMDCLFSSYGGFTFQDEEIKALLDNMENLPLFTPFIRTMQGVGSKTKVITYALYDTLNSSGKPDGAIIVNVDLNKFNDEIRQLLTFSEEEKSEIFIFSQENVILDWKEGEKNEEIEAEIKEMVNTIQFPERKNFILESRKISGEKYGIFFTNVEGMDWIIVKVQSYNEVFSNVNRQIMMIFAVSFVFVIIVLMSLFFLSRKIYSPIGELVEKVKGMESDESSERNEFQYLNQSYEELFRKAGEYKEKYSKNKIILTYHLQNLLLEGKGTDSAVWESLQAVDPVLFRKDNFFGVSILKIDDYQRMQDQYNHDEMELYKFVIDNIFTEALENHGCRSVIIPLGTDKMVTLFHGDFCEEKGYRGCMEECFHITNEYLSKYFQISISMSVSPYSEGMERIHESYDLAKNKLLYKHALGNNSLIFYDYEVEQADSKETDAAVKLLSVHIQEGKKESIPEDFARLTELVKKQDSDHLMEFITSQVVYILHTMAVKEKANNTSKGSVILERYTEILSLENWEEMSEHLQTMLADIMGTDDKQNQKTKLLVSTIQKMVQEEYEDPNLCLQQISEMMNMSSQYVGRMFKGIVGISVAEYLNEYRLKKSIEIMMKTGCTISEVLTKVGIETESQYYRMFKKKYGTTPKAYMLELMVSEK